MSSSLNLRSEGDINISSNRAEWAKKNISNKATEILDRDADCFLHQSLSTPCLNVLTKSKGATITTIDGKTLLDFHGNYVHNLGFGHPSVIKAITEQMESLSFCTRRYTNKPAVELAEKLVQFTNNELTRVLFTPSGTAAIGMALKIARMVTGKHKTISLWDSFHGASLDAISIGGEALFRNGIGPLLAGTEHAPPPNPSECPFKCGSTCANHCANYIEYMLEKEGDVCAVIAETIRATPFIPSKDYWQTVREACNRHGALLILDEIPHALGRTGTHFTYQQYDIVPDIVVIGKGLGGGIFPLAAVIAKEEFNDLVKHRAIGHYTHEKNPVACAAALAMLKVIDEEHVLEHVKEMSELAQIELKQLASKFTYIHDVRIIGLIMGIELRIPSTSQPAIDVAEKVMYRCLELGLSFKLSMGSTINLTPPINITPDELTRAFEIIEQALGEIL